MRPSINLAVSVFLCDALHTNVYIDGFNLYYGATRKTSFKWLNLRLLAEALFPTAQIRRVCYFTALVKPRPHDPTQPQRQQVYLRALRTLPDLDIIMGDFRERRVRLPLAQPQRGGPKIVEVIKSEEKGTDVNLASRLLIDGFRREYEQAVIISNDSDLASPMKFVKDELKLKVSVVNPSKGHAHRDLVDAATYVKRILKTHLHNSQFPSALKDAHGTITKPASW